MTAPPPLARSRIPPATQAIKMHDKCSFASKFLTFMGISQILVINRVGVLGNGPHTPTQLFPSLPGSQL